MATQATDESIALLPLVQQQKVDVNIPRSSGAITDVFANRPTPGSATGVFFFATDQVVLYLSTGTAWARIGDPAGLTAPWYTGDAPDGWVAYDGSDLPASTGIYADLFAHLGGLTTPDTQGRGLVFVGTNTDVSTVGNSDGLSVGSRSPKHNATNSLTFSGSVSGTITEPDGRLTYTNTGSGAQGQDGSGGIATFTARTPTFSGSVSGSIGGTIGPGGSRPTDAGAYITFNMLVAKL